MKKKIYLLFPVLLFTCSIIAQNPIPENAAIWKEQMKTFAGFVTNHYAMCGDTLINNLTYSKIERWEVDNDLNILSKEYFSALRSENQKVYYIPSWDSEEYLLYDFNLEVGGEIELPDYYSPTFTFTRTVDSVKTEMIAGQQRKVIYFQPGYPTAPVEYWMEGIGSSYSLMFRGIDPGGDIGFNLLCFQHEDEYLNLTAIECFLPEVRDCGVINSVGENKNDYSFSVFPNPTSDFIRISQVGGEKVPLLINLYHVDGRLVKHMSMLKDSENYIDLNGHSEGLYFVKILNEETGQLLHSSKIFVF